MFAISGNLTHTEGFCHWWGAYSLSYLFMLNDFCLELYAFCFHWQPKAYNGVHVGAMFLVWTTKPDLLIFHASGNLKHINGFI